MPGNMEYLSRSELEQRLTSTLIMVEVLSQQLTSVQAHNLSKNTSPSDLREKLVQTDHTELRQVTTQLHRKLFGRKTLKYLVLIFLILSLFPRMGHIKICMELPWREFGVLSMIRRFFTVYITALKQ